MKYIPASISDYPLTEILAKTLTAEVTENTRQVTFKGDLQKGRVSIISPTYLPDFIEREYIDYTPASALKLNENRNLVGQFQYVPVRQGTSFYESETSGVSYLGNTTHDNIIFHSVSFKSLMYEDTDDETRDVFIDLLCLRSNKYLTSGTGCIAYAYILENEIHKLVQYYPMPREKLLQMIDPKGELKLSNDVKMIDRTLGQF